MINQYTRFRAASRQFVFDMIKMFGVFRVIKMIPGLSIKEPWNKLYNRSNKRQ